MNTRLTQFLLYLLVAIFAIAVGIILYWEYQPTDILDIKSLITVEPPIAHSGSPIVLTLSYCKNRNASGTVRTSFVGNAIEIFQPMAAEAQSPGCHTDTKAPILLPPATVVPPGMYKIKFNITYRVNPLKTTNKIFYTQEFKIE